MVVGSMKVLGLALIGSIVLHVIVMCSPVTLWGERALQQDVRATLGGHSSDGPKVSWRSGGGTVGVEDKPAVLTHGGAGQVDLPDRRNDRPHGKNLLQGRYFSADAVTRRPVALSEVHLAGEYLLSGMPEDHALLRLWIEASGRVSQVDVEASAYPLELTQALREAFGGLVFRPGEVDGVAVPVMMRIEARYGGT